MPPRIGLPTAKTSQSIRCAFTPAAYNIIVVSSLSSHGIEAARKPHGSLMEAKFATYVFCSDLERLLAIALLFFCETDCVNPTGGDPSDFRLAPDARSTMRMS